MEISEEKNEKYSNDKEKFFEAITNGDNYLLNKLLYVDKIPFWELYDHERCTSLIKTTFLNNTEISLYMIETAHNHMRNEDFLKWLNHKSNNGFSSLHYASFRGNIKILEKLIEKGIDINTKNNNGLNVMHMASQGDQPNVLVYFKEKHNMKINALDNVLSTPLHWASYMGSESCVDYLISWSSDINTKDKDGFTPLHLAVMTEKSRVIRKLIKLGADINSEDCKSRKPIDVAIQRNNSRIVDLLRDDIQLFTCKLTQYKADGSSIYPFVYFIYSLIIDTNLGMLIMPHFNSVYKYGLITSITTVLNLIYFKLYYSDPGVRSNKLNKPLLKLALEGEVLNNICPWCEVTINSNTKHCYYCNKCIENIDHHCIWIKNCIGKSNFQMFFLFLLLLFLKIFLNVFFSFESFFLFVVDDLKANYFKFSKLRFLYTNKVKTLAASVEIILGLILLVPLMGLIFTHLKTFYKDKKHNSIKRGNIRNEEEKRLLIK